MNSERAIELIKEYERRLKRANDIVKARTCFKTFITLLMPHFVFNWHHEVIINALEDVARGKIKRLSISAPPRHGKSELTSKLFTAWLLGINPRSTHILAAYSAGLANGFNRGIQGYIDSDIYRAIFPGTKIPGVGRNEKGNFKRTESICETFEGGGIRSVGVQGTLTGFGAGDGNIKDDYGEFVGCGSLIIDDPVKDSLQASSTVYQDRTFSWYGTTAKTRVEKETPIIICQTRWHIEDLTGKILKIEGSKWTKIVLPAICEYKQAYDPRAIGQALWPSWYNLDALNETKEVLGSRDFAALYQQTPVVAGGNIIKEKWLQFYAPGQLPFKTNEIKPNNIVQAWDLQFKKTGSSYTVGGCVVRHEGCFYLVDFYRKKADIIETQDAIVSLKKRWPRCNTVLIEEKANGNAIIDLLKKKTSGLIPFNPEGSKEERLNAYVAPIAEAGNLYLPLNTPYTKDIIDELVSFPNSANDDICDMISMALARFNKLRGLDKLRALAG